jgi:hypothetical protein
MLQAGQVCVFRADKEDARPDRVLLAQVTAPFFSFRDGDAVRRTLLPAAALLTACGGFSRSSIRAIRNRCGDFDARNKLQNHYCHSCAAGVLLEYQSMIPGRGC